MSEDYLKLNEETETENKKPKKKLNWAWLLVLVLVIFSAQFLIVKTDVAESFPASVQRFVFWPVAVINYNNFISYSSLAEHDKAMEVFANKSSDEELGLGVNFSSPEERHHIAQERLIRDTVIAEIIQNYNLEPNTNEINEEWDNLIQETGKEEDLLQSINEYLGWNKKEYLQFSMLPALREIKLHEYYLSTEDLDVEEKSKLNADIENKMVQINEELNSKSFADVAKEFSEDPYTATEGGNLGFVKKGDLGEDFDNIIFDNSIGLIAEPIKTDYGTYLVKIENIKYEGDEKTVDISYIYLSAADNFDNWLDSKINEASIIRFTPY
ncbi:MAG: peptidylprolyl isomerase [bacterium]